jgi:DNA-binding beta-propeller fold protein YncE
MKSRSMWSCAAVAVTLVCLWLSGCGGGGANVVTVTVTSSVGTTVILGQSTTLTASVTGGTSTNVDVNWQACQFTTTTVSGTSSTTSKAATCPTDGTLGALTNELVTGTATYTAPSKVPNQTTYPGLAIIITAQAQSDTSKSGFVTLTLDSGIGVTLTPVTATVPTNEQQQFSAVLTNDLQQQGVTWLVTQSIATTTITEPNLATCSPTCGTITSTGLDAAIYTAPAAVPTATNPVLNPVSTTPQDVTVVATAKSDNTRFVIGTITIVQGGPITFNGISPTIAPQGATLWDIYLDAPNISSASIITLTDQNGGKKTFTSIVSPTGNGGQVKVLFPIPTSTTTAPASIGARLRLLEGDLAPPSPSSISAPLTYTVSVTDPGEPVTKATVGNFSFTILPVRPTLISSSPTGVIQNDTVGTIPMTLDGGYFGPGGQFATAVFQGNKIPQTSSSNSRQLDLSLPTSSVVGPPGLYPLSLSGSSTLLPTPNNPAVSSLAVFPDYSTSFAQITSSVPAGTNPSAIDIDPTLGVVVVAETGSNAVQFFSIAPGTLTPLGGPVAVGQVPTGLSVNRTNHSVAVVNYISQSVTVLPIPGAPVPVTPVTISLANVLQGQAAPAPLPYSIGVDPDTNLALVAYSSTSSSSFANVGFVVNLNRGAGAPFGCLGGTGTPPCVYSQVTLNTDAYPQIAMAPHGHLAYVTPGAFQGGSGVVRGVDVTQPSTSISINSVSLASGVVTVTTNGTLTGLIPGIPATVLITGIPTTNAASNTNFNGVYSISVTSSNTFAYVINNTTASGTASGGTVFYGSSNFNFGGLSATTQGISINPITNTAALADSAATGGQIDLLNQLDQSFTTISLAPDCTFYSQPCPTGAELPGTANVAWQPYTNSVISYNPGIPSRPVNQVSISDPVTRSRRAYVCGVPPCTINPITDAQVTLPGVGSANISVQNGTTGSLTLWGGLAVDPATNQAFVVESGSGGIQVINLAPSASTAPAQKPTEITEVVVPSPTPGPGIIGGIPKAFVPQGTLTSAVDLAGVQIFGTGFVAGAQVRLDGNAIPAGNVTVNPNGLQITATIPASFLSAPHHYALDVISGTPSFQSNPVDFFVVQAVDMSGVCAGGSPSPSSVAIADQVANGPFSPLAVVTNSGCNSISTIDINPTVTVGGVVQPNPTFGHILHTIAVGSTPQGIAISQHFGLAVVANNGDGTASVVNLLTNTQPVAAVTVGTNPVGVAINDATGAAIVANFGSNTVSEIDLGLLIGSAPATSLTASTIGGVQQPIAVAIDPDRGTNNQGLAVVTGLQLVSGSAPNGALFPVDIGLVSPVLSTTISVGSVSSTPTGIVFNPAVATGTANPGLFYVNSSGANAITSFNPDNGSPVQASVGINPTGLAINPQTGAMLTSNFAGKSVSIVDTLSNPMKTQKTIGLPGSAQFGVAIDQFTNLAVVVDQANNRVFLFPMPN